MADGRLALVRAGAIWTVASDGSAPVRLTTTTGNGAPRWSPDGTRLAFTRVTSGVTHLWVMNADGSGQKQVSALAGVGRPDWSPDGRTLAFIANYDSYSAAVYHVASRAPFGKAKVYIEVGNDMGTTDGPTPLYGATSFAPTPAPSAVTWSRDGTKLSFFNGSCYAAYIRCIDSYDPANQFTSTTVANTQDTTGKGLLQSAAWSPDSGTLLTAEQAGSVLHLDVGPPPSSPKVANATDGVYSPTGTRLAFTRIQNGVSYIWVSAVNGTAAVRVATGTTADWQPTS